MRGCRLDRHRVGPQAQHAVQDAAGAEDRWEPGQRIVLGLRDEVGGDEEGGLRLVGGEELQRARGASSVGTVTQLEVQLTDDADPDAIASAIDSEFRSGPVATTTRSKGVFQTDTLSDLAELIGFAHWLGYACVGLVLGLVATSGSSVSSVKVMPFKRS